MGRGFPGLVALAVLLGVATTWIVAPLFRPAPPAPPVWAWAPGYWEISPLVGIARVIPLAPSSLVNPAASAVPKGLPLTAADMAPREKNIRQAGDNL